MEKKKPLYKAKTRGYDGVKIIEAGEEFSFEGVPGKWMEPMNDEASKAMKSMEADKKAAKAAAEEGLEEEVESSKPSKAEVKVEHKAKHESKEK